MQFTLSRVITVIETETLVHVKIQNPLSWNKISILVNFSEWQCFHYRFQSKYCHFPLVPKKSHQRGFSGMSRMCKIIG